MTFANLQLLINQAYSNFCDDYIKRKRMGASEKYSIKNLFLIKVVYKTLMNQDGDETVDILSKEQIQDIIKLFNKYSNSTIQVEYD